MMLILSLRRDHVLYLCTEVLVSRVFWYQGDSPSSQFGRPAAHGYGYECSRGFQDKGILASIIAVLFFSPIITSVYLSDPLFLLANIFTERLDELFP